MAGEHAAGKLLGHMVYFTLKDKSPEAVEKLLASARKYLSGHPGTIHFSIGTHDPELDRPVNQKFDVALQLVFQTREAQDAYQVSERHVQYIEENKDNWESVQVFDANVMS